jgi:hypothetical protein
MRGRQNKYLKLDLRTEEDEEGQELCKNVSNRQLTDVFPVIYSPFFK